MDVNDPQTDDLLKVLESYKNKRIFIAVLGSPDPDGLASAWVFKVISEWLGVKADILTFEIVSRPDNAVFMKLLDIPHKHIGLKPTRTRYHGFAVLDRQNPSLPIPMARRLPLIAHIDHHAPLRSRAQFVQQDLRFGSTSSIMAFHLKNLIPRMNLEDSLLTRLCTALAFGIRTDTRDLLNATSLDFQALSLIAHWVSSELLHTFALVPYGKVFLSLLGHAIADREEYNGLVVAYGGKLSRNSRDMIGQTADFFSRVEGYSVVVVFGLIDEYFVGSLRTTDPDLDTYEFLESALSSRLGFPIDCGGRRFAAGFQIPFTNFEKIDGEPSKIIKKALIDSWKESYQHKHLRKKGIRKK